MRLAIERVPPGWREGARNLVHYVALRQVDLRDLQGNLFLLGLSSLGRSESCVLGSLLQTSQRAHEALALRGDMGAARALPRLARACAGASSWHTAQAHLHRHTHEVFGPQPGDRHIYIMATAPSAREADRAWMVKMLRAGMNVLRVNCAHEDEEAWAQLLEALAAARRQTGKGCRVLMDLAGPKIRTGPIGGARRIATWKPTKDELGKVTTPARVLITRSSAPRQDGTAAFLVLGRASFAKVRRGDELHLRDARGLRRVIVVQEVDDDQIVGLSSRRAYVLEQARAGLYRGGEHVAWLTLRVDDAQGAAIDVKAGDTLVLTRRATQGRPPVRDRTGRILRPGVVSCTLSAALDHLQAGHRVLFDDGRISTVVVRGGRAVGDYLLRVVRTQKPVAKLRAEKGINLPDTRTTVPSLTEEDRHALAFVASHADAVSLSFVRRPADVRRLHQELRRLGRPGIAVVLKIETREGFENLPRLLLEGLRTPPLAVMIARGDLAVEVGFERLSEVQEEILWLCEASHVPAIWATQVLDTLARTGVPTRAEITDAAASVAAECVMLNKGPFIEETVRVLSGILRRMEKLHYKKRSLFRKLRISTFSEPV
jgi:pyruvate kinase